MDLIDRIVKSTEYVTLNADLIAIESNILQDIATDLREEAEGVLGQSSDFLKIEFRVERRDEILEQINKIENSVKIAREALFDLIPKLRLIAVQAKRIRGALRDEEAEPPTSPVGTELWVSGENVASDDENTVSVRAILRFE
ncbi:uncharacterized protein LOC126853524 [Cataglyphis hispanica]|uniref:uncharacterized protein LOC126853524 n=1 Tax=Cataglyphis hispanica TaxID=1086592 RepID=UPI0021801588|nr:uncharacterized protein LOC126853524 [Cataglyphis hispanica]